MLLESVNYRPWITGSAQPKLTKDRLMAIPIPCPPEEEQRAIVKFIMEDTSGLRTTIEKTRKEIEFIREYRTRLVSDVVTGQLDVRGLDLPDVDAEAAGMDAEAEELDEGADEEAEGAEA